MRVACPDLRSNGQEVESVYFEFAFGPPIYNSHLSTAEAGMVAIAGAISNSSTRVAVDAQNAMPSDSLGDIATQPSTSAPKVDAVANFVAMYGMHSLTEASTSKGNAVLQGAREQLIQSEELAAQAKEADPWSKIKCFFGSDAPTNEAD
jgi:hypothetical protein